MDKIEFVNELEGRDDFDCVVGELDGDNGVFVKNRMFETETHFTWDAIEGSELENLLQNTSHGKNVEQMTRVTGYFSRVGAWNRGKVAELKDRSRVVVGA